MTTRPGHARREFDVFNGDADGLIARHQYRLALPATGDSPVLITGVKRDVCLCGRVDAQRGDAVNVFDISYDQNADAVSALLGRGVSIRYFDHHRATRLAAHAGLEAHIDMAADVCSSLLVDRFLSGRYRTWAIAAAYGDNLIAVATHLAIAARLSAAQQTQLRELGECLNYNAYGDSEDDLLFRPATLAQLMAPYANPFDFIAGESAFAELKQGYADDMARVAGIAPQYASAASAIYQLPDAPFSRRVSGVFANHLASAHQQRAHAVLTPNAYGTFTVSIRAPIARPQGADKVASAFAGGGGRAGAAGINELAPRELARLREVMAAVFADDTA